MVIPWNNNSHKKIIKGLLVNTKNANTLQQQKHRTQRRRPIFSIGVRHRKAVTCLCFSLRRGWQVFLFLSKAGAGVYKRSCTDDRIIEARVSHKKSNQQQNGQHVYRFGRSFDRINQHFD